MAIFQGFFFSIADHQKSDFRTLVNYNHFHNILRLFDVLPNLPFTTSETMRGYYLQTWYIRLSSRVAEQLKT